MRSRSQAQIDGKHADQETRSQQGSHEQQLQQQLSEQLPKQEQVETSEDVSDQSPAQNGEALLSQGPERTQVGISDAEIPQASGQIDCPEPSQGSESQPGVLMLLCVLSLMSRLVSEHAMFFVIMCFGQCLSRMLMVSLARGIRQAVSAFPVACRSSYKPIKQSIKLHFSPHVFALEATQRQHMPSAAQSQDAHSKNTLGSNCCCLQPLPYGSTWQQVQLATHMLSPQSSDCCRGPEVIKI